MIKNIYKKNSVKFLLSLIPVVIVGIMAPLRSYIMQLLIDFMHVGQDCLAAEKNACIP